MPIFPPKKRTWIAFNHVPGGNIVIQRFDYEERSKNVGDNKTETHKYSPEEQIKSFEKGDFVALNIGGKIIKNKVLIYDGPAIEWDDRDAANKVLEWARSKGVEQIFTAEDRRRQKDMESSPSGRIDDLDQRISGLEKGQKATDEKIDKILDAVNKGGAK